MPHGRRLSPAFFSVPWFRESASFGLAGDISMSLIHNERWKLTATALNGLAIATSAGGVIAPLVAISYGLPNATRGLYPIAVSLVWLSTAIALHLIARRILGRLRE